MGRKAPVADQLEVHYESRSQSPNKLLLINCLIIRPFWRRVVMLTTLPLFFH